MRSLRVIEARRKVGRTGEHERGGYCRAEIVTFEVFVNELSRNRFGDFGGVAAGRDGEGLTARYDFEAEMEALVDGVGDAPLHGKGVSGIVRAIAGSRVIDRVGRVTGGGGGISDVAEWR